MSKRLRFSGDLAITTADDYSVIVYETTNPSRHFHIADSDRLLLMCFAGYGSLSVREAIDALIGLRAMPPTDATVMELLTIIRRFIQMEILVPENDIRSVYGRPMARAYETARYIPQEICSEIALDCAVHSHTTVLDMCTGTGALAVHLARISHNVDAIDTSGSFLATAARYAKRQHVTVCFQRASGNKLVFGNKRYDLITVCQAFHWLDPIWASYGIYRSLKPAGHLVIIDSDAVVSEWHPLRLHFGYGQLTEAGVLKRFSQVAAHYTRLFRVSGGIQPYLRIGQTRIFRQERVFDFPFARAFLFSQHLQEAFPIARFPWIRLRQVLSQYDTQDLYGRMYWLMLTFAQTGIPATPEDPTPVCSAPIIDVGHE